MRTPEGSDRCRSLVLAAAIVAAPVLAAGATLPTGFTESLVASGLTSPTAMALAPDGRIFVCQQGGQLRVIKNGQLLSAPFVSLTVDSAGERGLLGVAFDPSFASNQRVYVYYTVPGNPAHNRVSRFTANGDVAMAGSETAIMDLDNLSGATNHNGGAMHFGPDGKLYIAVGENANGANAQSVANRLGKILRVNADGSIPGDNPTTFPAVVGSPTGVNRAIWAVGLRNPFTFAFQPGTGRMFINDVGQSTWEEVNDGIAGSNYGWPQTEGPNPPGATGVRYPLYSYANDANTCAITGGTFYNPQTAQFPAEYVGKYFFADFCGDWIRRLDPSNANVIGFATGISAPVDLQVGSDGSLYYLARGAGSVWRVRFTASQAPQITSHPADVTVTAGQPATFTVAASGTAPLSYRWQRDESDIPGATSASYTLNPTALSDDGATFRAVVTNTFGNATSNAATLTVTANNAPTATITSPAHGTLYNAGDTINYAGTGTDPEQGGLPPSAFTWQVDFHHDTHFHPFVPATTGSTSGSFTIPTTGETSANVWYRIYLTVRDAQGLAHTTFSDVVPRKVTLSLASSPSGLQLTLDGQPVTTPFSVQGVVGMQRALSAPSPQTQAGTSYAFVSWSDGGAATHTVSTPASDTTYTASYRVGTEPPGQGLNGTYWNNSDFTGTQVTRLDPTVNFEWGTGAPVAGIGPDTFSVRWQGQVRAKVSGTHTIYTVSDDGVRLWVNGVLIINNWTNHGPTENRGTIGLTAGQKYDLRMEFYENTGGAVARLGWSASGLAPEIVPQSHLHPHAPQITSHPANVTVTAGQPATFTVAASGSSLSYRWQRDESDIPGATSASYTLNPTALSDDGATFRAVVTNTFGNATSNAATLTVTANNAPTATITSPAHGTLYNAGDTINYAGTGTDPEQGGLPPSAFTWQVDFHHDTHFHPFVPATTGSTSGSFTIPTTGETSANVWYRIYLTVRDAQGLAHTTFSDVVPRKVTLSLASSPSGLQLTLDGQPVTTPFSVQGVVGMQRALSAPSPQTQAGTSYAFVSWSDGGAATHTVSTPASDTTYTASYRVGTEPPGQGLNGTYWNNSDFTGTQVTRLDPTVNFEWGTGAPVAGIGPDTFSVRWQGQVRAKVSGTHTIYTVSDDGVRLWVNGVLIINNWTNHGPTENRGTIGLTAGQKYDLRMEFYENTGGAVARLGWSASGLAPEIIPQSHLYP